MGRFVVEIIGGAHREKRTQGRLGGVPAQNARVRGEGRRGGRKKKKKKNYGPTRSKKLWGRKVRLRGRPNARRKSGKRERRKKKRMWALLLDEIEGGVQVFLGINGRTVTVGSARCALCGISFPRSWEAPREKKSWDESGEGGSNVMAPKVASANSTLTKKKKQRTGGAVGLTVMALFKAAKRGSRKKKKKRLHLEIKKST